ncbi:MAG: hypothetical protein JJD97_14800, partial [Gemmatimonadaceae bacterium]|nr:hypothetical protein [Gemmatimonadaceae bacterium]
MFGANELALRAFPFLCSIIALLLLWRVATRLLTAAVVPLALAPFALAPPLIFFAAEAKQYSTDVAIALALLLLALDLGSRELTTQRAALAAIAGAVAVWFSQSAVLVVAGLGVAMMLSAIVGGDRRRLAREACIVGAWAASAIAVTALSLDRLAPDARRYMYLFWNDGFWPLAPLDPGSAAWPAVRTAGLLAGQLALPMSVGIAATLCAAVGVWATWRKDRRVAMLLVAPLLVALGASAARLYPFAERLALFLIPSLLVLAAAGLDAIVAVIPSRRLASVAITGAAVALLALDARALRAAPPVYRPEEITPAIEYLRQNAKQTDAIYVYYGAVPAFQFYESARAIPGMHLLGTCHRGDPRGYLTELDRYRG